MESKKCKNCESQLNGKFCASCGQKVCTEKDKSIGNLLHEGFHFMTHFDGKFFNTLKTMYKYPGKLSVDYSEGIRQKYYKPVSFYLLIVLLYLLFPLASGMNMEMKYYKENSIFGKYLSHQIKEKLVKDNIREDQLSEKFHQKSKSTSKFLLLLLIPLSAPILYLLYFNKRRYHFDNFIFLIEVNIFFLLTFFILIPVFVLPFMYFLKLSINDNFFAPLTIVLFCFYCINIFHKVYKEKWWISVLKGGAFGFLFMFIIVPVYKTILFGTTLALI